MLVLVLLVLNCYSVLGLGSEVNRRSVPAAGSTGYFGSVVQVEPATETKKYQNQDGCGVELSLDANKNITNVKFTDRDFFYSIKSNNELTGYRKITTLKDTSPRSFHRRAIADYDNCEWSCATQYLISDINFSDERITKITAGIYVDNTDFFFWAAKKDGWIKYNECNDLALVN